MPSSGLGVEVFGGDQYVEGHTRCRDRTASVLDPVLESPRADYLAVSNYAYTDAWVHERRLRGLVGHLILSESGGRSCARQERRVGSIKTSTTSSREGMELPHNRPR